MLRTLHARTLFYFVLISLGGIVLVSLAIDLGFRDSFRDYLDVKREQQVQRTADVLLAEYGQQENWAGEEIAMFLHHQAMMENLYFRVFDASGRLVLDSTGMFDMHRQIMNGGANGEHIPTFENLRKESLPLDWQGQKVGTLEVYYVPGYVNNDFLFLQKFNKYIFGAAATLTILSILFSFLFSRRLTAGLYQIRDAARQLQRREWSVHIPLNREQPEEIKELSATFNQLAESLKSQEILRKQFTSDLAHELRTPLATLRSQLEAYQDGIWEPTPQRLQQTHNELMRLVRLVDDVEKLLAAENPQIQLEKEKLEAGEIIRILTDDAYPMLLEKGIDFQTEMPDKEIYFQADRDRLVQILLNLLHNAAKYTPPGGRVTLSVAEVGVWVQFIVEDTGRGIAAEDLPHIFERFYRGDKSRDRKTGGTGIGLSIVKALVQAHHGEVHMESEPEKGTKVVVSLPLSSN